MFFSCVIGICTSAAIENIEAEPEPKDQQNAIEEVNGSQSDLETAEGKHFGFGPRVVVINKGYGGYQRGYGGGCGCGSSHYHSHHRFYGKK